MKIIFVMTLILTVGTLFVQAWTIKEQIEIFLYFRRREKESPKRAELERKENEMELAKAQSEIPEWAEKMIDDYLASSEEDMRQ